MKPPQLNIDDSRALVRRLMADLEQARSMRLYYAARLLSAFVVTVLNTNDQDHTRGTTSATPTGD